MSDIRERCPISCIAHEVEAYACDSDICLKHKAYQQGYQDGSSDMEQAKQIIIDGLLKQIEQIRAEVIDEYHDAVEKNLIVNTIDIPINDAIRNMMLKEHKEKDE